MLRKLLPRLLVSLVTTAIILGAGEVYVRRAIFISQDAPGATQASRRWYDRYWSRNSEGFRDVEWTDELLDGKTLILAVGDSFTAGNGTKDPADRWSNQLNLHLGEDYLVMNAGGPGADPRNALTVLETFPHEPQVIVYSYFVNDIEHAIIEVTGQPLYVGDPAPEYLQPLLRRSALADYLYWYVYARSRLVEGGQRRSEEWLAGYHDPETWAHHEEALLRIIANIVDRQIPMVVIVFPSLVEIDKFQPEVARVQAIFEDYGIPVINRSDEWKSLPVIDRVANSYDPHPSVAIHHELGEILATYEWLRDPSSFEPTPLLELALSEADYEAFESREFTLVEPGAVIFNPSTGLDNTTFFMLYEGRRLWYDEGIDAEERDAIFDLMTVFDREQHPEDMALDGEQLAILEEWRSTKSAETLRDLGADYIFFSNRWRAFLTEDELDTLENSEGYQFVDSWYIKRFKQEFFLYRLN